MLVRHILQDKGRNVIVIAHVATIGEAAQLLAEKRIGVVIVTDTKAGWRVSFRNAMSFAPWPVMALWRSAVMSRPI